MILAFLVIFCFALFLAIMGIVAQSGPPNHDNNDGGKLG